MCDHIARKLVRLARDVMSMDFDTEKQMKEYLKEHPGADKSRHRVKPSGKSQKGEWDDEESVSFHKDLGERLKKSLRSNGVGDVGIDTGYSSGGVLNIDVQTDLHPSIKKKYRGDYESNRRYSVKVDSDGSGHTAVIGVGDTGGRSSERVESVSAKSQSALSAQVSKTIKEDLKRPRKWDGKPKKSI